MPATTEAPAPPGARAVARYVRSSASKARRVVDLVRGLPAKEALTVLRFAPQAASVPVYKVIASAIANAENNEQLDPDSLLVAEAYVDEGPTMRRYRPRAQMRPGPIRKRTCHITVVVEAVQPAALPPPRRRPAKQSAAAPATAAPAEAEAEPPEVTEAPAGEEPTAAPAKKSAKKAAAKATKTAKTTKATKKAAAEPAEPDPAEQPAKKTAKKATKKAAEPEAAEQPAKKAAKQAGKRAQKKAASEPAGTEEGTE